MVIFHSKLLVYQRVCLVKFETKMNGNPDGNPENWVISLATNLAVMRPIGTSSAPGCTAPPDCCAQMLSTRRPVDGDDQSNDHHCCSHCFTHAYRQYCYQVISIIIVSV